MPVGVVTGANKGIGLAIVRNLALAYPTSPLNNSTPLHIYLTARSPTRGNEALATLTSDLHIQNPSPLAPDSGPVILHFHALDITSPPSIAAFTASLRRAHGDSGVDFVVNNAGIALQGFDSEVVEKTLGTNYYGTLAATQALLPLLRPATGVLVNVSSMAGGLSKYSAALRDSFLSAAAASDPGAATRLMEKFAADVGAGRQEAEGWPSAAYAVSKAGTTAVTKALANGERAAGSGRRVHACCPGYVKTEMTRGGGTKTVDEGARTPVELALGVIGAEGTGGFWQGERIIEW